MYILNGILLNIIDIQVAKCYISTRRWAMFNKKQCINNIYMLAKKKGIKIGELEETAGVSKGYLARINKDDSNSVPSIELLDSIASRLKVGIDFLVNFSDTELSPNEQFVYQFIDGLMQKTLSGKLDWLYETQSILDADNDAPVKNPLVSITKNYADDADEWYDTHVYRSGIYGDSWTNIDGNCYYTEIKTNNGFTSSTVYLNKVRYNDPSVGSIFNEIPAIEVYLVSDGDIHPICSTYYVTESLANAINNLYDAVASVPSRITLDPKARKTMKDFIDLIE